MRTLAWALLLIASLCRASTIGSEANTIESGGCFTGWLTVSGATCSGTVAIPGTSAYFTYDSYGVASYGSLGAYASGVITLGAATAGTAPPDVGVNGTGYFTDTFTIDATDTCGGNPCPATGSGTVQMQFLIAGSTTGPSGYYCMDVLPGSSPSSPINLNCTVAAGASFPTPGSPLITSQAIAFTFGQPFTLTTGFLVYGFIGDYVNSNGNFTANFADTSTLAGFVIDDSGGKQLSNFSVSSASGTEYPNTTVPELSPLLAMAVATPILAWRHSRRLRGEAGQV